MSMVKITLVNREMHILPIAITQFKYVYSNSVNVPCYIDLELSKF